MPANVFKKIQQKYAPYLIIVFCIVTLSFYVYVKVFLKSAADEAQSVYDGVAKLVSVPAQAQPAYKKFEETPIFFDINGKLATLEEALKKGMPGLKNFGTLADRIQSIAAECDIELIKLNIFNPSTDSPADILSMKIRLECRSTYKSFKKFLWCMENCTNIIFIRTLNISSKLSEEKLTYNFDLESFIRKQ